MHMRLIIHSGSVLLSLLGLATVSVAQPSAKSTPTPDPSPSPIRIVYTGKFLGYLRVPSLQPLDVKPNEIGTCPAISANDDSRAATKLFMRDNDSNDGQDSKWHDKFDNAIRVSTGDNFAPQLEARVFRLSQNGEEYIPGNKERWDWFRNQWVRADKLPPAEKQVLENEKAHGYTTVPTDNVACFLSRAGYSAVVPGKHDFYFGAERVRELARFMATIPQPVQMLGANLVIKTSPIESPPSSAQQPKWPDGSTVEGLKENKPIYPWFSPQLTVTIPVPAEKIPVLAECVKGSKSLNQTALGQCVDVQVATTTGDEKNSWIKISTTIRKELRICAANELNEISGQCQPEVNAKEEINVNQAGIVYSLSISPRAGSSPGRNGYQWTFDPGKTYGLCQIDPKVNIQNDCFMFPVYQPFFNLPLAKPVIGTHFTEPDPFKVIRNETSRELDVAIFGVVDPNIAEEVGVLNFSWLNNDRKLKSVLSAEDPAEALKEQLDYFNTWYKTKYSSDFIGLKVLLAQMSPQRARMLAVHLKEFQVVVTAADEEQGTSDTKLSSEWSKETPAGTFIAVPLPYYDSNTKGRNLEGTIHLGMIEASPECESWKLDGSDLQDITVDATENEARELWDKVHQALKGCLTEGFQSQFGTTPKPKGPQDEAKWLTLCAMRESLGADVALLQKRDLFDRLPQDPGPLDVQQLLDRIIWKGDLLTLMYVPGGALKSVLEQSKRYETEDVNKLSLADESFRGLAYLGIKKTDKEYLINEAPLDDKKIYAVATTDYIGAGDTGYPDFKAAALDPKTVAQQFPEKLDAISAVVCRKLFDKETERNRNCLPYLQRDEYLDPSIAEAPHPRQPSFWKRVLKKEPFKWPSATEGPKSADKAAELKAQQHPFWLLSLKNASLSFGSLSNNLSDADLANNFGGVSASGVNAKRNQTIALGLDVRASGTSHRGEPFIATGIDYKKDTIGDGPPVVSQKKNRATAEAGYIWNLRGGRSQKRFGLSSSLYLESQLQRPFTDFKLGTGDMLRVTQNRSLLLLARVGLRWQNASNLFEAGVQTGEELNALAGYRFDSGAVCLPNAAESFADCIKRQSKSSSAPPTITKNSLGNAIFHAPKRSGFYWRSSVSIPFSKKVKYELTQKADFFFTNTGDNATDTRYWDESKHSLKFTVWPSLAIGPSLRLLLYENKVNKKFLFQREFGFETSFSFDLFNHREKLVQIKHKP